MLLILFAFLAGVVTVFAPCILPVLPLVLAGGSVHGRLRPLGIIIGLVASFSLFTLTLSWLVQNAGLSPNTSRTLGVIVLAALGLLMLVPGWLERFEAWWSARLSRSGTASDAGTETTQRHGFGGGLLLGIGLGTVWTPCAGPILASVTTVAATGGVSGQTVLVTVFYALGAAIPMAVIAFFGQKLVASLRWLKQHSLAIQRTFGVVLLVMAALIATNLDRKLQAAIISVTPNWLPNLQRFEERAPLNNNQQINSQPPTQEEEKVPELKNYGPAPELTGTQSWINSEPLKLADLRGKVVLVKFWTYSCINCIRTLPYVQAWYDKYHDDGFEIVAVHTPEFAFEKVLGNVQDAVKDFTITYPVVQDNDYATWKAYGNHYWPAKYFIDANGNIRYAHFGEGKYEEQEAVIRELLKEAGKEVTADMVPEEEQTLPSKITPETYFGSARMDRFASPENVAEKVQTYTAPSSLDQNEWALQGPWSVHDEYATAEGLRAELRFRFTAKTMYVVMAPEQSSQRVDVYVDGQPSQNVNVAPSNVDAPTIYQVASFSDVGTHELRVVFPNGGVRIYAATFGATDAPGVYCDQSGKCAVEPLQ